MKAKAKGLDGLGILIGIIVITLFAFYFGDFIQSKVMDIHPNRIITVA